MVDKIAITACGAVLPDCISKQEIGGALTWVAALPEAEESSLNELLNEKREYRDLDRSVLLAILAARRACSSLDLTVDSSNIGINVGSSRGATNLFERHYGDFLKGGMAKVPVLTSPTTTLGNLSSWVAQDRGLGGANFSHSATCTTALHAVANGLAWLRADMAQKFIVGGAEAPLTAFTLAQMKALRIYASQSECEYPCRPCETEKAENNMVLGEGAAIFMLERFTDTQMSALATIEGIGLAREHTKTKTSVSEDGEAFERAMRAALSSAGEPQIDAMLLHAPGTIMGDDAELGAIGRVFTEHKPALISNKWRVGHSLGASGAASLYHALQILKTQSFQDFPYAAQFINKPPTKISRIMINAAGFGGNSVSLIIAKEQQ